MLIMQREYLKCFTFMINLKISLSLFSTRLNLSCEQRRTCDYLLLNKFRNKWNMNHNILIKIFEIFFKLSIENIIRYLYRNLICYSDKFQLKLNKCYFIFNSFFGFYSAIFLDLSFKSFKNTKKKIFYTFC